MQTYGHEKHREYVSNMVDINLIYLILSTIFNNRYLTVLLQLFWHNWGYSNGYNKLQTLCINLQLLSDFQSFSN